MLELIESDKATVLKHYGKTEEDLKNDIQAIFQWMEKQPHFPSSISQVEEARIRALLIHNKFSLERTKYSIDLILKLKHLIPEIFSNLDILSLPVQQAMNVCFWIPLPKLTPDCNAVGIVKLFDPDPKRFNPCETAKLLLMLGLLRTRVEFCIGEHVIYDCKGYTIAHMKKLTPSYLKKLFIVITKAIAYKAAGFHILYPPPGVDPVLSVLKMLMKPKIFERISIHNDLESLHKSVPKEILPKEYGGNERSIYELRDLWKEEMEKHRDFFIEEEKTMVSDESKRIDNLDDIFGSMHGSFRQIQID